VKGSETRSKSCFFRGLFLAARVERILLELNINFEQKINAKKAVGDRFSIFPAD